jgi:hypothetical protein
MSDCTTLPVMSMVERLAALFRGLPDMQLSGNRSILLCWVALLLNAVGCGNQDGRTGPSAWTTVLRLRGGDIFQVAASPDGALFAAGRDGVYRAWGPSFQKWERLGGAVPGYIFRMFAPSAHTLYALTDGCAALQRWDERSGWQHVTTTVSDSAWTDGDELDCVDFRDVWGRDSSDVYVAGTYGTVVHYDGRSWVSLPTGLRPGVDSGATAATSEVWSVTGDESAVYAGATATAVAQQSVGGPWRRLPAASGTPNTCGYLGAAVTRGVPVFAAGSCVMRLVGDSLVADPAPRTPYRSELFAGQTQIDGSALFWNSDGDIVELRGPTTYTYRLEGVGRIGRVVSVGSFLYAAGTSRGDGTVLRIERWRESNPPAATPDER